MIDSIRTLTLENGEKVREQLVKHMPDKHKLTYMMIEVNPAAFPINTHGSTISIKSNENGGSTVRGGVHKQTFAPQIKTPQ